MKDSSFLLITFVRVLNHLVSLTVVALMRRAEVKDSFQKTQSKWKFHLALPPAQKNQTS